MESFYILLILTFLTGAIIGFFAGFIRIAIFFIKAGIAFSFVYFLHPHIFFILSNNVPPGSEWLKPFALSIVFIIAFFIAHLLLKPIAGKLVAAGKAIWNRLLGLIAGAVVMFIAGLFFTQSTDIIETPELVKTEMEERGLTKLFALYNEAVQKNGFAFQSQPVKVMGSEATGGIIENGVLLSFRSNNFVRRWALENEMLLLVNVERVKYGLRPFVADTLLQMAAAKHGADMFIRGYFSHNTPEGIDPFQRLRQMKITYRYAGENLAMASTLIKAHEGLMKSPGHRANILNPSYKRIGIAVLDGGMYGLMITQEFRN